MKNKNIAFGLNFFLPGAGFLYLRRFKLAGLNLAIALAIGTVLVLTMPESFWEGFIGRGLPYAIGGASGAWAMQVADEMNEEAQRERSLSEIQDEASFS